MIQYVNPRPARAPQPPGGTLLTYRLFPHTQNSEYLLPSAPCSTSPQANVWKPLTAQQAAAEQHLCQALSGFWGTRNCDEQVETGPAPRSLPSLGEVTASVAQSRPTPCDPVGCGPPGSPLGFSGGNTGVVALHSREPSRPGDAAWAPCVAGGLRQSLSPTEALTGQKKPRLRR